MIDIMELMDKAEEKIQEALKGTKNLYIDDVAWGDTGFRIPVKYEKVFTHVKEIDCFMFILDDDCEDDWNMERFQEELDEFVSRDWKKLDK